MEYSRDQAMGATTLKVDPLLRDTVDILIALDTEYVARPLLTLPKLGITPDQPPRADVARDRQYLDILSYQWTALDTRTGRTASRIYLRPDERLALGDILILAAVRIPRISATQSRGMLPPSPWECCHPVHGMLPPSERSDAGLYD